MKKTTVLLTFIVICFFVFDASAQWYVGGNAYFNTNSNNDKNESSDYESDVKRTSISINPSIGYFISDNVLLGLGLNYRISNYSSKRGDLDYESKYTSNLHSLTFEPYLKHYMEITEKIHLTNQAGLFAGVLSGDNVSEYFPDNTNTNTKTTSEQSGFLLGLTYKPGFNFNITEKLNLELGVGYLTYSIENNETTSKFDDNNPLIEYGAVVNKGKNSNLSFSYNQISLGVSYKF